MLCIEVNDSQLHDVLCFALPLYMLVLDSVINVFRWRRVRGDKMLNFMNKEEGKVGQDQTLSVLALD